MVSVLSDLSKFIRYDGTLFELMREVKPTSKHYVFDGNPGPDQVTYCIKTVLGWVVFYKGYKDDLIYPSIYGILIHQMEFDIFAEARAEGIDISEIEYLL